MDFLWTPGGYLLVIKKKRLVDIFDDPLSNLLLLRNDKSSLNISTLICAAGVYDAALTVSDGKGDETTVKVKIIVGNKPVPSLQALLQGQHFLLVM